MWASSWVTSSSAHPWWWPMAESGSGSVFQRITMGRWGKGQALPLASITGSWMTMSMGFSHT